MPSAAAVVGVGVEVAAPRVRAHELLGDVRAIARRSVTTTSQASRSGVNVTDDVHTGSSGWSAVMTATSMSTYVAARASRSAATTRPVVTSSAPACAIAVAPQALAGLDHRVGARLLEAEDGEVRGDRRVQRARARARDGRRPRPASSARWRRRRSVSRSGPSGCARQPARPMRSTVHMHPCCIICAMAYRAGVVGGVRLYGGRAAAAAGRPPGDRGRARHRRLERGRARWPTCIPALAPGLRRHAVLAPLDAADLARPRPRVLHAAARREPGAAARVCSTTSAHVIDLGADFRLPPDVYARWYGEPHRAPEVVGRFAYGLVELYRDELATHAHVAAPGCYPDRGEPRVRAAARARARRAARHRRRGVGRVGRGPRAEDHEPVLGGERERLARTACSRTATPRRWSRRSRRSRGRPVRRVVHAAPRADDARHPRHLLRAAADRRACRPRGCSSTTASSTPTIRAWSWSTNRRARRRRTAPTSRTSPCASTSAPTPSSRSRPRTTS